MIRLTLRLALAGSLLASCATMQSHDAKSELTTAGFKIRQPDTPKKREIYESLPDQKLERVTVSGKVYYVFKDEKSGVAYVGGESEHQRYQQICRQEHTQPAAEEKMDPATASKYKKYWGGRSDAFLKYYDAPTAERSPVIRTYSSIK